MKKKIIVTGGAGFIASHVADAYIKVGHKVVIIDNLLTGSRKNINPKAKFYKADIRDLATMERIFKKERPEAVNHHAAIGDVTKSVRAPIPSFETNVMGTINLLIAFGMYGRGKKRRFIFSSSGGTVYGAPKNFPTDESTERLPLSPYGASKVLDEDIIMFYGRYYGFDSIVLRYPNPFGPRQNPKSGAGIVPIFADLMKKGVRPTIFGDGTKSRDYIYVSDIARLNVLALAKGKSTIVNAGSGKGTSDKTVFDAVAHELNFKEKPIYAPYRKGEVYRCALDGRKAKKIFGWAPKVSFQEGVHKTIASL